MLSQISVSAHTQRASCISTYHYIQCSNCWSDRNMPALITFAAANLGASAAAVFPVPGLCAHWVVKWPTDTALQCSSHYNIREAFNLHYWVCLVQMVPCWRGSDSIVRPISPASTRPESDCQLYVFSLVSNFHVAVSVKFLYQILMQIINHVPCSDCLRSIVFLIVTSLSKQYVVCISEGTDYFQKSSIIGGDHK